MRTFNALIAAAIVCISLLVCNWRSVPIQALASGARARIECGDDKPSGGGAGAEAFKSELKNIAGLPVLLIGGDAASMGSQAACSTAALYNVFKPFPAELAKVRKFDNTKYSEHAMALAEHLLPRHRQELESFARQNGITFQELWEVNAVFDVYRSFACSSLLVDGKRTTSGNPLFGRNLDFSGCGILDKCGLVTVYHPTGFHSFASVGFPGQLGVISGMNDAGLALAAHTVWESADHAPLFNAQGMPLSFLFRQILEECSTLEQATELLKKTERTTILNLPICDLTHCGVIEITPKSVEIVFTVDGVAPCTNHFVSTQLTVGEKCDRYAKLTELSKGETYDIPKLDKALRAVNNQYTLQTMVFDPVNLDLYLAMGKQPSTDLPLVKLELKPLFK